MGLSYQTTIIGAIVGIVFLMVMVVTALGITGRLDATSTPLIMSIFGTAATIIVTLLNIVRTDRAVTLIHKTNGDVGDLTRRMEISDPGGAGKTEGTDNTNV